MIWAATSRYSAGHIITTNGRITASDYVNILGNRVHPVIQILTTVQFFKMTVRPYTHSQKDRVLA